METSSQDDGVSLCYNILILVTCLIGDVLLSRDIVPNNHLRAVLDNLTHGLIGFWSWAVVVGLRTRTDFLQCFLAFILASVIDVDHFLAAKSLRLQDALSLPSRPFFHASTVILPLTIALWTIGEVSRDNRFHILSLMFFTSWTSHHIRDAHRRGLWFPPFGETPPLRKNLYLCLLICIPLVVKVLNQYGLTRARRRQIHIDRSDILFA
ncbi:hypothetical protein FSP39_012920 [Pinctada imbricata]|uniref:Transmembrane protein 267 n=1 Tax=Pinctada imbricata TaxID=66713 RepID=A0AA89BTK1_PINIB|nr:hypothetical protein FSP39_012920 [Pinctada imbricata]